MHERGASPQGCAHNDSEAFRGVGIADNVPQQKIWTHFYGQVVVPGMSMLVKATLEAAVRECMEELGVKVQKDSFNEIFRCSPCQETGNEFVRVYTLFYEREIVFDPLEIYRIKNFTLLRDQRFSSKSC